MFYAVDFDGTITKKSKFPEIGELNPKVVEWMRKIHAEGHKIGIWTCRVGVKLEEAVAFLLANDVPFDYVNENPECGFGDNTRKIYADRYVDDRAVHPADLDLPEDYNENLERDLKLLVNIVGALPLDGYTHSRLMDIRKRYGL